MFKPWSCFRAVTTYKCDNEWRHTFSLQAIDQQCHGAPTNEVVLTRTGDSTVIYSDNVTDTNVTISDLDAVTMYSLTVTAINDEGFRSEISDTQKYTTKELGKAIFATPTENIVNYLCSPISTLSCNDSMHLPDTQFNCATKHI